MKNLRFGTAVILASVVALLAACANTSTVRISNTKPAVVQTKSRSEPIFYNGKTYHLDFAWVDGAKSFDMKVSGMGAKQKKDAVAVATSSLGYFACPEGQKGRLTGEPTYTETKWHMQARCG